LGVSAPAPLAVVVVVVVVGELLDVEDVLADVLVVALLSVLDVVVLAAVVEISADEAVVVVVLLELEALALDEIGVAEVFAGTGIDCVHEDTPAATTRVPKTTDTWRRHLRSAIRCPPCSPQPTGVRTIMGDRTRAVHPKRSISAQVQSIVHTP
jgi:hypothetical protein